MRGGSCSHYPDGSYRPGAGSSPARQPIHSLALDGKSDEIDRASRYERRSGVGAKRRPRPVCLDRKGGTMPRRLGVSQPFLSRS